MSHAVADQRRSERLAAAARRRLLRNLPKSAPNRDAGHRRWDPELRRRGTAPAGEIA